MRLVQFTGEPMVAEGAGWSEMTAEEFKAKAIDLFGPQYAKHMSLFLGMNRSTFQQFAKGGPKGRVVPRSMAVMLHLLDLVAANDLVVDDQFLDYEVRRAGPPRKKPEVVVADAQRQETTT